MNFRNCFCSFLPWIIYLCCFLQRYKKTIVTKEILSLKSKHFSLIFKEKQMTSLSIVLVLLAVALWQLTKIFDLTQVGSNPDSSEIATDDDNNQGYLMFGFLAFLYIFQYGFFKWGPLFFIHLPLNMV
jgi:hypothetical protein